MEHARQGRVLVVEDSAAIRAFLEAALTRAGFEVVTAGDGETAVLRFLAERPDVILLDIFLPRMDGWQALARIREVDETVPVIVLTASETTEHAKVRGLMAGADDYLLKPVGAAELVARVRTQLRHRRFRPSVASVYDDGVIRVDFRQASVAIHGRPVSLTPLEFRLLAAFIRRGGTILSPRQLMELVWHDYSGVTFDPVKVYVGYLRRKLAAVDGGAELIETVRGYGYRYVCPASRRLPVA